MARTKAADRLTVCVLDVETGEATYRPMMPAEYDQHVAMQQREQERQDAEGQRESNRAERIAAARAKAGKGDTAGALADVLALLEQQA